MAGVKQSGKHQTALSKSLPQKEQLRFQSLNLGLKKMNHYDAMAITASAIALELKKLTQSEIGYLFGVLAENDPILSQQIAIAIKLNLEENYGNKYPIA
jgi:hypothetical protein